MDLGVAALYGADVTDEYYDFEDPDERGYDVTDDYYDYKDPGERGYDIAVAARQDVILDICELEGREYQRQHKHKAR